MADSSTDLEEAKNSLLKRASATADQIELAEIRSAIRTINVALDRITSAGILRQAALLADATDALERVIASARLGPFQFLDGIQKSLASLSLHVGDLQGSERLPPAPDAPQPTTTAAKTTHEPAQAAILPSPAVDAPEGSPPHPINSRTFETLANEYQSFFHRCELRPEFKGNVDFYVSRLLKSKAVYQSLGNEIGGIPWAFIGVIHGMECGFNFTTHLHNGDPLTARTVNVPAGCPSSGDAPFSWLESARDALTLKRLDRIRDWSIPRVLYQLEAYNGFGYRSRGIPSPYLWSFSKLYSAGKYVADGTFSPTAVSKQCGAAVMLHELAQLHELGSLSD